MEKLSQKWAIIAPLEPVDEGVVFPADGFPLHVTFAGVFASEGSGHELAEALAGLLADQKRIHVTAEGEASFGANADISVVIIERSAELLALYDKIYALLVSDGATFNSPQYEGAGYVPHSTIQKELRLSISESAMIDRIALIDLFPGGDGYKRKVFRMIDLI